MGRWTKAERETVLQIDEESGEWIAYTASLPMIRNLDKIARATRVDRDEYGNIAKSYVLAPNQIRFYGQHRVSDAQIAALARARAAQGRR